MNVEPRPFQSTEEFLAKFDLSGSDYYDPVELSGRRVAFSVKRKYPPGLRYRPPVKPNGEPDSVAALWVVYLHPSETAEPIALTRVPIRLRIATMSLYLANHYDYDENDDNAPTRDSLRMSARTPKPIELEYDGDYFYDHAIDAFVDSTGSALPGIEILDKVFADHCRTVHLLRGLPLRTKLALRFGLTNGMLAAAKCIELVLKQVFGRTLEPNDTIAAFLQGYPPDSLKKLSEDTLNLFGYRAAKPVVVLFSAIVAGIASVRFLGGAESFGYLGYITSNVLLTSVHAILLLWGLDALVPALLFRIMNHLIRRRAAILLRRAR